MREVHRRRNINAAINRDVQQYSAHLTPAILDRSLPDAFRIAGEYGVHVLKGLSIDSSLRYLGLTAEGISEENLKLEDVIERIRQEEAISRGDQTHFPSRPMLAAMSVRALVGDQMRIRASSIINQGRDPDSIAKFYGLNTAGYWVNDATESVDRAEGVLKNGLRAEALAFYPDPSQVTEEEIIAKERRYKSYSDRLMVDRTGISVMELSLVKTVAARFAPEVVSSGKDGNISDIRMYAEHLALEAYKLIYDRTAPASK